MRKLHPFIKAIKFTPSLTPDQYAELVSSFVEMGKAGANMNPRHPMRAAWENARRQIEEYQAARRGSAS